MDLTLGLDVSLFRPDLKKLKVNLNKAKNMEHQWVPHDQLHIPLCSLGKLGQGTFSEMDRRIQLIKESHQVFQLKLEGVGAYPNQDQGRLLWVGVQNSKELRELQSHLIQDLEIIEEQPFKPYLPLVRLRNFKEVSDILSPHKNADFGKFLINQMIVYDMIAGGAFPIYRRIKNYPLRPKGITYLLEG